MNMEKEIPQQANVWSEPISVIEKEIIELLHNRPSRIAPTDPRGDTLPYRRLLNELDKQPEVKAKFDRVLRSFLDKITDSEWDETVLNQVLTLMRDGGPDFCHHLDYAVKRFEHPDSDRGRLLLAGLLKALRSMGRGRLPEEWAVKYADILGEEYADLVTGAIVRHGRYAMRRYLPKLLSKWPKVSTALALRWPELADLWGEEEFVELYSSLAEKSESDLMDQLFDFGFKIKSFSFWDDIPSEAPPETVFA